MCFRESRYLLFLTENYAALRILQQDLLFHAENPPFVLFGSSFPKDREYTQVLSLLHVAIYELFAIIVKCIIYKIDFML